MLGLGCQIESSANAGNMRGAYMLLNRPFGLSNGQAAFYREKLAREGKWTVSQIAADMQVEKSQTASSVIDIHQCLGFADHVIGDQAVDSYAQTAAGNVLRNLSWISPMIEIVELAGKILSGRSDFPLLGIESIVGALKNTCFFSGDHIDATVSMLSDPKTHGRSVRTAFDAIRGIQGALVHSPDVVSVNPLVQALIQNPPLIQNKYYVETFDGIRNGLSNN